MHTYIHTYIHVYARPPSLDPALITRFATSPPPPPLRKLYPRDWHRSPTTSPQNDKCAAGKESEMSINLPGQCRVVRNKKEGAVSLRGIGLTSRVAIYHVLNEPYRSVIAKRGG